MYSSLHIGIYLLNRGKCWRNGSYFRPGSAAQTTPISCVHSAPYNGGGWVLPNGAPCTNSTTPFECNIVAADGPTDVSLLRIVNGIIFTDLGYKCCLPNGCDDGPTDVIIANIFGKVCVI